MRKEMTMNLQALFEAYPQIESENIILKEIQTNHIDGLFKIYDNDRVFTHCGIRPKHNKKTVENMIGHFRRDFNKKSRIKLGIFLKEERNALVGIIEVMDIRKKVECATVGYYLAESYWGKGIATESLGLLVDFLFKTVGFNRLQAEVMVENESSKRVLVKNGFQKEGTIRQGAFWAGKGIVDLEVYGILKKDY